MADLSDALQILIGGRMNTRRSYDGWWFFAEEKSGEKPAKQRSSEEDLSSTWLPFSAHDSDRLERALHNPEYRDAPDELLVHDSNGHRLKKVKFSSMTAEPVYWSGSAVPVRRAIWMQMRGECDIFGGSPVPLQWDDAIEGEYQKNKDWIYSGSSTSGVVEKLAGLPEPLSLYVMVLRRGVTDTAKLTRKSVLEQNNPANSASKDSLRFIRGYLPYHIAVVAAIRQASSSKNGPEAPPLLLPSPFEEPDFSPPKAPKVLLLTVHGIGQKLAGKFGIDFPSSCTILRGLMVQMLRQRGDADSEEVYVLPISWRDDLKIGSKYFAQENEEAGPEISFEDLVSKITLNNIPAIRDIASDVCLDILLYMTPLYFQRIIKATLDEMHRVYNMFIKVAGEGARETKVSLIGHSLGSAIIADLLSFVTDDLIIENIQSKSRAAASSLGFSVDKCFLFGSPLALFFLLRQLKPVACISSGHDGADPLADPNTFLNLPHPSDGTVVLEPRKVIFSCAEIYNIFHPCDPSKRVLRRILCG